ncbi:3'-5' exonuclease [Enterobacter hormaechei]|uniref:3'-5' exonuclease n=1 Tax=Enterobacter hormaechei TaxID=158836 RepID=UPI0033163FE1
MNDLMIDMETLGVSVSSPIISIAAVYFDLTTGEIGDTFYKVVKLDSALEHGVVEPSTLSWWMAQPYEARKIFSANDASILEDVLKELSLFMLRDDGQEPICVWGNGASFDNAILSNAYRRFGMALPWQFRKDRDVRTIVDLAKRLKNFDALSSVLMSGVRHNALDDALYQIEYVSAAYHALRD